MCKNSLETRLLIRCTEILHTSKRHDTRLLYLSCVLYGQLHQVHTIVDRTSLLYCGLFLASYLNQIVSLQETEQLLLHLHLPVILQEHRIYLLHLTLTCLSSCSRLVIDSGASNGFSSFSVSSVLWVLVTTPARGSRNTYFLYLYTGKKRVRLSDFIMCS